MGAHWTGEPEVSNPTGAVKGTAETIGNEIDAGPGVKSDGEIAVESRGDEAIDTGAIVVEGGLS